ncbi:MAG: RDD family protein, partial [Streptosporangiaceae bacterium]
MTEVVTGEAVVLDVPCAQFPSRLAALLIDMVIQITLLAVVVIVIAVSSGHLDEAEVAAILVASFVVIVVGYPTIFETLTRGKTLGKMAIGLRVVSDDGGAERFRQALVRALTGAIEIWTVVGAPIGLILSMVSARGKRLGDMFAGTYVIQERAPRRPGLPPALAIVPPPLLGWAQVAEISRLSDQNAEAASSYLRRLYELRPAARDDLGLRIASAVVAQVSPPPPPGTPPAAYLAAVLAIRRDREFARLASQHPAPAPGITPPAPGAWTQPSAPPPPPGAWTPPPGAPPPGAPPPGAPPPPGPWTAPP